MPGSLEISGYQNIHLLCHSPRTSLFRARCESSQNPVLLKMGGEAVPSYFCQNIFQREYAFLRERGDEQGLLHVRAMEWANQIPFLIFDDFVGESLAEPGLASLSDFFWIGSGLVSIVQGIHKKNYIHQSLHPSYILIDRNKKFIKLHGFGLASPPTMGREALWLDPIYISPEQTGKIGGGIDFRSDLYSLGVIFYQMLTGRLPFRATGPLEWIFAHLSQEPLPISGLPQGLTQVIFKLLAKAPAKRYQSAQALLDDLEHCQKEWESRSEIPHFILGQSEEPAWLPLSGKNYGRKEERKRLFQAWQEAQLGGSPVLLVGGESGVGKTSLIWELNGEVQGEQGFFLPGKFDQNQLEKPHSALSSALSHFFCQILFQSQEKVTLWQKGLEKALGNRRGFLNDLTPLARELWGDMPFSQNLPAKERENLFYLTLVDFLSFCARADHPVILFIDDIQWAPGETLRWIEKIAGEKIPHLLIVGAYRTEEIGEDHPLQSLLIKFSPLLLPSLSSTALAQWMAESFEWDSEIAQQLWHKTGGNPFFLRRLLQELHRKKTLVYSREREIWILNFEALSSLPASENAIDLLTGQLKELEPAEQILLKKGALLGHGFSLEDLCLWESEDRHIVQKKLESLLQQGFLTLEDSRYEFLHDKIQQTCADLSTGHSKAEFHGQIGKLLLSQKDPDRIFEVVHHLNLAEIEEPEEKLQLSGLNLYAGQKAREKSAFGEALLYFDRGISLLPLDCWENHYSLAFSLHIECAESLYIESHFDRAEECYSLLFQKAKTPKEHTRVAILKITQLRQLNQNQPALRCGIEALQKLDYPLSLSPSKLTLIKELVKSQVHCLGKKPKFILNLPKNTHPNILLVMEILSALETPAFMVNQELFHLILLKNVNLSFRYGLGPYSSLAFVGFGCMYIDLFGNANKAYRWGNTALELEKQFSHPMLRARIYDIFTQFIAPWKDPIQKVIPLIKHAYQESLRTGDLIFATLSLLHYNSFLFFGGESLEVLSKKVENNLALVKKWKMADMELAFGTTLQVIRSLRGETHSLGSLEGDNFSEEALFKAVSQEIFQGGLAYYNFHKLQLFCIKGDYKRAYQWSTESAKTVAVLAVEAKMSDHYFYQAIALAQIYSQASWWKKISYGRRLRQNEKKLRKWARSCPENWLCRYQLILAERARIAGKNQKAEKLYDQAIEWAGQQGYLQIQAIASELAGRFYMARGKKRSGKAYLEEAYLCYKRWGALAKTKQMEDQFPQYFRRGAFIINSPMAQQVDFASLFQGALSLSEEIVLEKLFGKILPLLLKNSGAQRAFLLVEKRGKLYIEAWSDGATTSVAGHPLEERTDLARGLVYYSYGTGKEVIYPSPSDSFPRDPYVESHREISLLILPLFRQSRFQALLYLEHSDPDFFSPHHLKALKILGAQGAIALENARLYRHLKEEMEEKKNLARLAALGELSAFFSHEIRNPLEAFCLDFQRLVRTARLSDHYGDLVENMQGAMERVQQIVQGILNYARPLHIERKEDDLCLLVEGVIFSLKEKIASRKLEVKTDFSPNLPKIWIDPNMIIQVVTNLIENAIQAEEDGGKMAISVGEKDQGLEFSIWDDGVTIPPEKMDQIFRPFYTTKEGNFGLGLALCKKIVQAHGGTIQAESQEKEGTIFFVCLPLFLKEE